MWRKVLIACIALVGTFSVIYASCNNIELNAATSSTAATGITARINLPPSGLSVSSSTNGFKVGDKIATQAGDNAWLLLRKETYTDYMKANTEACKLSRSQSSAPISCLNSLINGWWAGSVEPVVNDKTTMLSSTPMTGGLSNTIYGKTLTTEKEQGYQLINPNLNNVNSKLDTFDAELKKTTDYALLTYRNLTNLHKVMTDTTLQVLYSNRFTHIQNSYPFGKEHLPHTFGIDIAVFCYDNDIKYFPYESETWANTYIQLRDRATNVLITNASYTVSEKGFTAYQDAINTSESLAFTAKAYIRANTYLGLDNVVFSASNIGEGSNVIEIPPDLDASTQIYKDSTSTKMIARMKDASMTVSLGGLYQNGSNTPIGKKGTVYKASQNSKIDIGATASSKSSAVSAFLFDKATGDVKYYFQNLGTATGGASKYTMDLTGIPLGSYQLAIVNEQVPTTNAPTYVSSFSSVAELDVVTPLSSFTYNTKSSSLPYGSSDGVLASGSPIGGVSVSGGTAPYTYEFGASGTDTTSYKYFHITGHSTSQYGTSVFINTGAVPNGKLPVGTYKFRITVTDANGASLFKDVIFSVTQVDATIAFVDSSIKQVAYKDGFTFTENIIHTDTGAIVTYSANNAIASVKADASGNASITLNSSGAVGDVVITATLPATTNYKAATTKKTIRVYEALKNFKFTPSKKPITVTDTKESGFVLGTLSIEGGMANYTFEIEADPNGEAGANVHGTSASVDTTATNAKTTDVKTSGQLNAGTYNITFKVTDSNSQVLYLPVEITVTTDDISDFNFYDYENTDTVLTNKTKQIPYGSEDAFVLAKANSGTGAISYKIKDGEPTDVFTLDTSTGAISDIQKKGSVVVQATKAKDSNYNSKTIEMTIEIIDGIQEVKFDSTIPSNKKFLFDSTLAISATLTREDKTNGEITYASLTSDICTIEDPSVAKLTMKKEGDCIVTASNSDENYEAVSDTKTIKLYTGITGTLVQSIDPLHQGDAQAMAGSTTIIARVNNLSGGDGQYNFDSIEVKKNNVSIPSPFTMDSDGSLTPAQDLKYGSYEVSLTVKDGNNETSTIQGTITIELESNQAFKIILDGAVVNDITSDYVTAQNPKITLSTQGKKGTGAVTYHLSEDSHKDPAKQTDAITLDEATGIITVHRAMTSNDLYKIYASVEEDTTNGYAKQVSQIVTVRIEPSSQSITFDATVADSLKFEADKTFAINASLDRSDGSITYSSTTPSICVVEDSTKPVAMMVSKGDCVIQAENSDENYEKAFKTKSITLFDGMAAKFTQVVTPLKQGDTKLDPSSNSVIGKITNLAGNQGEVKYSLQVMKGLVDVSSDFEINTDGEVLPKNKIGYGNYDVEVTLVDDTGADGSIIVSGTIIVELEENTDLKLTYKASLTIKIEETYADVKAGFSVGITGKKGSGKVHYHLSEDSQKDPSEASEAITVNDDGTILVHRAMSSQDVYKVYASVEENLSQGFAEQISNTVPIYITTADMGELSWLVDGLSATELHETYAPNKKLQLDIDGKLAGSTVKYTLIPVDGLTIDDVVKVDENTGEVTILHANLTSQIGQVQIKAVVSCAGYDDTELPPLNVQIDKAEQTDFRFAQNIYVMPYGTGSFTPEFLNAALHDDGATYNNKLSCPDPYDVRVEAAAPDTFIYDVTEAEGASITIKARNLGNRDYKAKEATAILKVLGENESLFDVTVSPSPVITYGEDVTILPDNPESDTILYTYESMDDTILLQDEQQKDVFHSKKVGTVQIKVTKTETGMAESIAYVSVRVKPKIISVELDGTYEIKTGEAIPSFTLKDITSNLVNGDVLPKPDVRVAIANTDTAGSYPITVTYLNDAITSNYSFQQVPCDLIIIQDEPEDNWYKIYKESDPTKSVMDTTAWYNEPLMVESIHSAYTNISLNGVSNWNPAQKLDVEGIYATPLYFKEPTSNAFTSSKEIHVKLDYTKPIIKSMTGSITDQSGLWKLLHDVTFGTFFKPKTSVFIHVEDPKAEEKLEVSGVKSIQYKVYLADEENDTLTPLISNGTISSNDIRENKAAIVLHDPGKYYVCASASDFAGNPGEELCSYLHIKGKGDDSDGDGIPDLNIDIDDNGKPDINITKNPNDKIPYTNIDTNGDGIADTNIDLDGDGEPDLNIGIVHEWKPYIEVDIDNDGKIDFKTGADIPWERNIDSDNDRKPDINVDINKDGIPDINIDTDNDFSKPEINIDNIGDGLPHINIDDNEDGKPDRNIVIFTKWEPEDDVETNILYDTMYNLKAKEILIHEETEIVVEASPDHAFLPNNALKVEDQTKEKAEQMQSELSNKLSDKQAVEQVYRISIINELGEEEEVQDVLRVKIPISPDVNNPIFYLTKKDGTIVKMDGSIEDGYFVFETDELGLLSVVVDNEGHKPKDPEPDPPKPEEPSSDKPIDKPKTDVQGSFTNNPSSNASDSTSIGGAYTGDTTNRFLLGLCMIGSLGCLVCLKRKRSS